MRTRDEKGKFGIESWPKRFWDKVSFPQNRTCVAGKVIDCWLWMGSVKPDGYAQIRFRGRSTYVHRISYELVRGKIPVGMFLDHLCRNRCCVNPFHLEVVTNRENVLRGVSPIAWNINKTHCPKGHPYDAKNTRVYRGFRYCRTCGGWTDAHKELKLSA